MLPCVAVAAWQVCAAPARLDADGRPGFRWVRGRFPPDGVRVRVGGVMRSLDFQRQGVDCTGLLPRARREGLVAHERLVLRTQLRAVLRNPSTDSGMPADDLRELSVPPHDEVVVDIAFEIHEEPAQTQPIPRGIADGRPRRSDLVRRRTACRRRAPTDFSPFQREPRGAQLVVVHVDRPRGLSRVRRFVSRRRAVVPCAACRGVSTAPASQRRQLRGNMRNAPGNEQSRFGQAREDEVLLDVARDDLPRAQSGIHAGRRYIFRPPVRSPFIQNPSCDTHSSPVDVGGRFGHACLS